MRRIAWVVTLLLLVSCARGTPVASPEASPLPSPWATSSPLPTSSTVPPVKPVGINLLWRFEARDVIWDLDMGELDGDGSPEVIGGSYDKGVYVLSHDGSLRWRFQAQAAIYSLVVADLDGDGVGEVVAGSDDNHIYALSPDGGLLWSYETGSRVVALESGDLNNNGSLEILASSRDGQLYALNSEGQLLWQAPLGEGASCLWTGDLNSDGRGEVLAITDGRGLVAFSSQGDALWRYERQGLRGLDVMDGHVVVRSRDGGLYVLEGDGSLIWEEDLGSVPLVTHALDLEEDGVKEILIGQGSRLGDEGGIRLLNYRGEERWRWLAGKGIWALETAEFDGETVIAGGCDDGNIYLLDAYGRLLASYQTGGRIHGLVIRDLDQDGVQEVVARSSRSILALEMVASGKSAPGPAPAETPVSVPAFETPLDGKVTVVAVGDMLLSRTVEERMEAYGSDYPLTIVDDLLRSADIAIGNLESPLTFRGEPITKEFLFRGHPSAAAALSEAGFDVLNLANNHVLDFGDEGLSDTLAALDQAGIRHMGAGLSEEDAHRPVIIEAKGLKIAFLSYAAKRWEGSYEVPTRDNIAFAEVPRLVEDVEIASREADIVVVVMHLGTEYQRAPDGEEIEVAEAAIEAGATLVIGHHTHVVQDTDPYLHGLIAYSLGDFVFDMPQEQGAILRVVLSAKGVEEAEMMPLKMEDGVQPRFLADAAGQPKVDSISAPAYKRTVIGHSVEGRPILAYGFGEGRKIVLLGDIHGGTEANTYELMNEILAYCRASSDRLPPGVSLWVIPALNPDGLVAGRRANARGVDLNRNADTNLDSCPENDWTRDTYNSAGVVPGGGGEYPFSEPESRALRDFASDAIIIISYHSQGGMVIAGGCEADSPSRRLARVLSQATGYRESSWMAYPVSGEMMDYFASLGAATAEIELTDKEDTELARVMRGVQEVLNSLEAIFP